MSYDYEPDVRGMTSTPGIMLIVTGGLNVLTALGLLLFGVGMTGATRTPEFHQEFKKGFEEEIRKNPRMDPEERKQMEAFGRGFEQFMQAWGPVSIIYAILSILCGMLILIGGATMLKMRMYALSVFAALLAILPCSSPCCLIGAIGGIWGLTVLMNADVRRAFR